MKLLRALAAVLALLALAGAAQAHRRSLSYSTWRPDADGARVHARVSQLDLSRLGLAFAGTGDARDPIAAYLSEHLTLRAGDAACAPIAPAERRGAPEGWALYTWRVRCPSSAPRSIESALLLDVAPSHLHFAQLEQGGRNSERVLSEADPRWHLAAGRATSEPGDRSAGTSFAGYVALGIEHILTGWDHLAFVLALLLLAGSLGEVAVLVTAFTVAHSVTLGLATLGWAPPDPPPPEALIGFSIALVAAENSWILAGRGRAVPWTVAGGLVLLAALPAGAVARPALLGLALFSACHFGLLAGSSRPARLRAAVAFAFGLVHGFGFAGVLAEMQLATARLVPALFGFNVGVELGQLAAVALVWPLLRAVSRAGNGAAGVRIAAVGSAAVCAVGVYWFIVRNFG